MSILHFIYLCLIQINGRKFVHGQINYFLESLLHWCKREIFPCHARRSKHSTCSTFPMCGRSWSRLFSGTCSHSRIWSSSLFLRVWSLISAADRMWTTPSCWTGGLNYGPVSTWYRSRAVFPGRLRSWPPVRRNLFVRITRGPVSDYSGSSSRARARLENWSIQRGMLPPGTMTTVHSNVYKHRAIKRTQLAFDSHSLVFCGQLQKIKNWSIQREMLLFPLSVTAHNGANKRATAKYASSWSLTFARWGLTMIPFTL